MLVLGRELKTEDYEPICNFAVDNRFVILNFEVHKQA